MNEIQRKCALVFKQGLEMKGWKSLDECTLIKNYCIFKMYDNNSPSKVGMVLPSYSWTLSREFIPLCAGRISSTVANIQLNGADKEDIESVLSIVKDLERYAAMPRYLQFANKMQVTKTPEVVTSLKPVKAPPGSGTKFIQILDSFEKIFKVGAVYELLGENESGIVFSRYDVKSQKQVGRMFMYTNRKEFSMAAKNNKLQPVLLREVSETQMAYTYTNTDIVDYNVPEELLGSIKSDYIKGAVMQLYHKNRNFTPLLNADYNNEYIDDICNYYMENNVDADLTGKYLNENVFDTLNRFIPIGFTAPFILEHMNDEMSIQNAINYIVGLSEPPYNVNRKYIKALYPLAGQFDPMNLPECGNAELLYLTLRYGKTLPSLVRIFSTMSTQLGDSIEIMPAHMTTDFIADLKKVFKIKYPIVSAPVEWNAVLDSIIKHAQSVNFSIKDGFSIGFYHYFLHRDYNSVFITDKNGNCFWRATCVDEKVYCDYNTLLSFGLV